MDDNEKLRALLAEARAEVERLKVQVEAHETRHRLAASEIRGLLASLSDARHEGNKARAEAVSAFRRGAEAMREAVTRQISVSEDSRSNIILALAASGERASDKIMVEHDCLRDVLDLVARTTTPKDKP